MRVNGDSDFLDNWEFQLACLLIFEHCIKETSASHNVFVWFFCIWLCVPFYILVLIHNTVGLIASNTAFIFVKMEAFHYRSASKRHTHTSKNEPFRIIILIIWMETVSKSTYPQLFHVSVSEVSHIFWQKKWLAFAHNCKGITWFLLFFS